MSRILPAAVHAVKAEEAASRAILIGDFGGPGLGKENQAKAGDPVARFPAWRHLTATLPVTLDPYSGPDTSQPIEGDVIRHQLRPGALAFVRGTQAPEQPPMAPPRAYRLSVEVYQVCDWSRRRNLYLGLGQLYRPARSGVRNPQGSRSAWGLVTPLAEASLLKLSL